MQTLSQGTALGDKFSPNNRGEYNPLSFRCALHKLIKKKKLTNKNLYIRHEHIGEEGLSDIMLMNIKCHCTF